MTNANVDWTTIARYLTGDMSEEERMVFEKHVEQKAELKKLLSEVQFLWNNTSVLAQKIKHRYNLDKINVDEKITLIKQIIEQQESEWTRISVLLSGEDVDGEKVTTHSSIELDELTHESDLIWKASASLGKKLKSARQPKNLDEVIAKMQAKIEETEAHQTSLRGKEVKMPVVPVASSSKGKSSLTLYQRLAAAVVLILGASLLGYYLTNEYRKTYDLVKVTTIETEVKKITLPDGSMVWLNKKTNLSFPPKFTAYERRVFLDGEAFFEIKRNEEKPFVVQTAVSTTKVLGTAFNLKAYSNENVVLSVEKGKVLFFANDEPSKVVVVGVDEAATLQVATKTIVVTDTISSSLSVWKQGKLTFKNATLVEVAQTLEKAYNVKVVILDKSLEKRKFTGEFDEKPLKYVLDRLAEAMDLKYEMKEDTVEISK